MSQPIRKPRTLRRQARGTDAAPVEKQPASKKNRFILAAVILAVIGAAIGIGYYFIYVVPLQQAIIKVNDTEINMDYFIRRMLVTGASSDIFTMIDSITNEEIIRQVATKPPYNFDVTDEDVMEDFRAAARGENETISDAEFKSWYRDQRNESGLSDKEFKDLSRTYLLASLMHEYLAERVPSIAEQVYLNYMVLFNYEDTLEASQRLEDGEDFEALANELSGNSTDDEQSSDLGWWPLEAMGIKTDTYYITPPEWIFSLAVGEYGDPVLMDQENEIYGIFMVSERADAREIDEDKIEIVKSRQLEAWLDNQAANQVITLHGRNNGFDSETHAWLSWQLSRRQKAEE